MENDGRVVDVTNISQEDFTHAYGGTPFTIKAGQTVTYPFGLGEHLARHLARRILLQGDTSATSYDAKNPDKAGGRGVPIINETNEREVMTSILSGQATVETVQPKSEVEMLKAQIADLNKFRESIEQENKHKGKKEDVEKPKEKAIESAGDKPVLYSDKADVIKELKKRKLEFNPKLGKDKLEELLK